MPKSVSLIRLLAGCVVPYNVVEVIRHYRRRKRLALEGARADAFKRAIREQGRLPTAAYSWADAFDFLAALGCDRGEVGAGSMPEASLIYACGALEEHIESRPVLGLHVGNFVGVSLCHFTNFVRRLDGSSIMVSIDPNLPHRGIHNPLEKVINCLNHYGLQGNSMILTGYTLEKSVSNDGVATPGYDPEVAYSKELSCENQLSMAARLMPAQFDFVVIDGNHDETYLRREVPLVHRLLKPGGMLVMDDVDWTSIQGVYRALDPESFQVLRSDRRVGLARKKQTVSCQPGSLKGVFH